MNIHSKKYTFFLIMFFLSTISLIMAPPLTNAVLKLLDGVPFALDGATIWDMMRIRYGIKKIQVGIFNSETKEFEGTYLFQGKLCSLHALAVHERTVDSTYNTKKIELESLYIGESDYALYCDELKEAQKELEKKYHEDHLELQQVVERTLEDEHVVHEQLLMQETFNNDLQYALCEQEELIKSNYIQDLDAYKQAMSVLKKEQDAYQQELAPVFIKVKEDVLKVLAPFSKKIKGAKKFLYKLVEEFCQKRQKPQSFLLNWATIADGQEFVIFNKTMTNCNMLDSFSTDLTMFLKDVIDSCPKGWQQFLELSKPKK